MNRLDQYIDQVSALPPAPRILPQLLALLGQPDSDSSQVVSLISLDPSLTAQVLKVCNSAYFAGASPASDLQEAVTRIGFRVVYEVVAAVCGSKVLAGEQQGYGIDEGELWQHAVACAVGAQILAEETHGDVSTAFTAALLHDLGKIVLSQALEGRYTTLIEETTAKGLSLLEAEQQLLGADHAEVGARLLTRWGFPDNLVAAVRYHHQPQAAGPHLRLAAYVHLGNIVAYLLGRGFGTQAFAQHGHAEAWMAVGLTPGALQNLMIFALERLQEVEARLKGTG